MKKSVFLFLLLLIILSTSSCRKEEPLKVAVMTVLESGSIIGSSEIDALRLYLKENDVKNIEIIPFNDGWDPLRVPAVYQEIREAGIDIIITSHTSTCAVVLKELTDLEQDEVLVFITGSTTNLLTGIDDNNIRLVQDVSREQKSIADNINSYNFNNLLIVRDLYNINYTEPALRFFTEHYKGQFEIIDFSIQDIKIHEIEKEMEKKDFDAVYTLIGGNQSVSGTMAQLGYIKNPEAKIFFTPWNNATTVVETSGEAIKNVEMANHYSIFSDESVKGYMEAFKAEFGYLPTYNSLHLYKTIDIIHQVNEMGIKNPSDIKAYIIETKVFETPFGRHVFDEYGDTEMDLHFIQNAKEAF